MVRTRCKFLTMFSLQVRIPVAVAAKKSSHNHKTLSQGHNEKSSHKEKSSRKSMSQGDCPGPNKSADTQTPQAASPSVSTTVPRAASPVRTWFNINKKNCKYVGS